MFLLWSAGVLIMVCVCFQIFEGVVNLLDRLQAWHTTSATAGATELKRMAQIGLWIITGYIQQQNSQVHNNTHLGTQALNHWELSQAA